MKIVIVTDAYFPQINGVVNTMAMMKKHLEEKGHHLFILRPTQFSVTIPISRTENVHQPLDFWKVSDMIKAIQPDAIHIATEGLIGIWAAHYCTKYDIPFTTSYHTMWPEYYQARFSIPTNWTYPYYKWFHNRAEAVLTTTQEMCDTLTNRGFNNVLVWGRGVDSNLFVPSLRDERRIPPEWERPIWLNVGRVTKEKNLSAFYQAQVPGTKVQVGGGPSLEHYASSYPDVKFIGWIEPNSEDLAWWYANSDVFVFPSMTDTFGIVMLEANACGLPVAAFPVNGPNQVVNNGVSGILNNDLKKAMLDCLELNRDNCRTHALVRGWDKPADIFEKTLVRIDKKVWPN